MALQALPTVKDQAMKSACRFTFLVHTFSHVPLLQQLSSLPISYIWPGFQTSFSKEFTVDQESDTPFSCTLHAAFQHYITKQSTICLIACLISLPWNHMLLEPGCLHNAQPIQTAQYMVSNLMSRKKRFQEEATGLHI